MVRKLANKPANLLIDRLEAEDAEIDQYLTNNATKTDYIKMVIETEIIERESTK